MNNLQLKIRLAELIDQVQSLFTQVTESQGKVLLVTRRASILANILNPDFSEMFRQYPEIGSIGFLGHFRFADCPEVKALATGSSIEKLEAIRAITGAVSIEESAQASWVHIRDRDPETASAILAICYLAQKKVAITKALK